MIILNPKLLLCFSFFFFFFFEYDKLNNHLNVQVRIYNSNTCYVVKK